MPINWESTAYFDPRHPDDPEYIHPQVLRKEYRVTANDLLSAGIPYKFLNDIPYYHEPTLEEHIKTGKINQRLLP